MLEVRVPQLVPRYTLNSRGHWAKGYRLNQKAKNDTAVALLGHTRPPTIRLVVTLVRCAPRLIDDDNSIASLKGVRDAVAKWLRVNDGSIDVTWRYEQRKVKRAEQGVLLRFEPRG